VPLGIDRRFKPQNIPEIVRGLGVWNIPFTWILEDRNANLLKIRKNLFKQRPVEAVELNLRACVPCEFALEDDEARGKDEQ
jgi:hypothetical protein